MKLSEKLKLNDFSLMTEGEMKQTIGGYGSGTYNNPFELPEIVVYGKYCPSGSGSKVSVCQGKQRGDSCCITWNEKQYPGWCIPDAYFTLGYTQLYCSDTRPW